VIPFESAAIPPVEPRVAWDSATAVARLYVTDCDPKDWQLSADWSALVAGHEPVTALPFCLGNFPQLVRDVHGLLRSDKLSELRPVPARPVALSSKPAEDAIRQRQYGLFLLSTGTLRLAKQFDRAEQLLQVHERELPDCWQPALGNERASLAWHRGDTEKAAGLWAGLAPSVPVLFNRGMAALFSDRAAQAKDPLVRAVEQLADDDPWHQLGRLYLALAGIRAPSA
jgi:hypothetical protein